MSEVGRTINYLFILALILILVAYWAGTNQVLSALFAGTNTLDLTATGRNAQGTFAAYPTNGPTGTGVSG
jgi:hypothetical protein